MTLRVMLADDHEMFREALRMFLEVQGDIDVVSEVTDGHGVLRELGQSRPDVVCMDIGMHGLDGIDTTRRALAIAPHLKVIGLSAHVEPSLVAAMFNAGALGYVVKGSPAMELLSAIRLVSQNQSYIDPALGINAVADLAPQV
jgi:two-component system NarL family response regulator